MQQPTWQVNTHQQTWHVRWHPADSESAGKAHGSAGICLTPERQIVVVSQNGIDWDVPAGRSEAGESWAATLQRELAEEACAMVQSASLLGFCQSQCLAGAEQGLILVRAFWLAQVTIQAWQPQFEMIERRLIEPKEIWGYLPQAYLPIYRHVLQVASLFIEVD
ncbi:NUDIX hydrolase [Herpetosiphon sp. NSE202]|uniref:NUDIX hydrolase n=1 Tax=Herpetosiphon sp. NSE202 TaxID=3351349 RepID=UPI003641D22A